MTHSGVIVNNRPNTIALLLLILSTVLMIYLFALSRNDPSLRIAALVAGTGLVSSLSSIASTILTGKDVTKKDSIDSGDSPSAPPEPTGAAGTTGRSTAVAESPNAASIGRTAPPAAGLDG